MVTFIIRSGPLQGCTLEVDLNRDDHGMWLNAYEPWVHKVLSDVLRPGMVTWDVGAYIGYYVLLMARLTGAPVVAFEPVSYNVARLQKNLALNHVLDVEVIEKAVSSRQESLRLVNAGEFSIVRDDGEPVESITLDSVLANHTPPALVLMDIEGAEEAALAGAKHLIEQVRPIWVLELHWDAGARAAERLRAAGYTIESADSTDIQTQLRQHQRTHIVARPQ